MPTGAARLAAILSVKPTFRSNRSPSGAFTPIPCATIDDDSAPDRRWRRHLPKTHLCRDRRFRGSRAWCGAVSEKASRPRGSRGFTCMLQAMLSAHSVQRPLKQLGHPIHLPRLRRLLHHDLCRPVQEDDLIGLDGLVKKQAVVRQLVGGRHGLDLLLPLAGALLTPYLLSQQLKADDPPALIAAVFAA